MTSPDYNERIASWKVLLPASEGFKVAVISGECSIPNSLSKNFKTVDWVATEKFKNSDFQGRKLYGQPAGNVRTFTDKVPNLSDYDIVVLIGCRAKGIYSTERTVKEIKNDGIFVYAHCNSRQLSLMRSRFRNFQFEQRFFTLPPKSPRVYIPFQPYQFRQKCLLFHHPGSVRARRSLKLLRLFSHFGFVWPFRINQVVFRSPGPLYSYEDSLLKHISTGLSDNILNVALYGGSDPAKCKTTLFAKTQNPSNPGEIVIKIGDTPEAAKAIHCEISALREIEGTELFAEIPRILMEETWKGYTIQIQTALPIDAKPQITELTQRHIQFLAGLSNINRQTIPVSKTKEWEFIETAVRSTVIKKWPAPARKLFDDLSNQNNIQTKIVCHRTHGDFAPWNIRAASGMLCVFDWEDSISDGLPFSDVFHFIFRQASLVGPWPGEEKILTQMKQKSIILSNLSRIPPTMIIFSLKIWMMSEYVKKPNPHIIDLIEHYLEQKYA